MCLAADLNSWLQNVTQCTDIEVTWSGKWWLNVEAVTLPLRPNPLHHRADTTLAISITRLRENPLRKSNILVSVVMKYAVLELNWMNELNEHGYFIMKGTISNNEYEMYYMMTSSNGNIFRITCYLCGEFTGHWWIAAQRPGTRGFDVLFDLRLNKPLSKQWWGWWFETPPRPL